MDQQRGDGGVLEFPGLRDLRGRAVLLLRHLLDGSPIRAPRRLALASWTLAVPKPELSKAERER